MKIVLAVTFALFATTASADEVGRYVSVAGNSDDDRIKGVWVTDTKTGRTKFCYMDVISGFAMSEQDPLCTAWGA